MKLKNVSRTAVTLPDGRQVGIGETVTADDPGEHLETGALVEVQGRKRTRNSEES